MRRVFFEELTLTVTFTDFNAHVQEHMLITLGLSHLQIFYSKVLALYTSFPTERQAHFSINGVNYIFHATLQALTYFHSTTKNTMFTHV